MYNKILHRDWFLFKYEETKLMKSFVIFLVYFGNEVFKIIWYPKPFNSLEETKKCFSNIQHVSFRLTKIKVTFFWSKSAPQKCDQNMKK